MWKDPDWQYVNAAETSKPGYLKRKFDRIRRKLQAEQEKNRVEVEAKVASIKRQKGER